MNKLFSFFGVRLFCLSIGFSLSTNVFCDTGKAYVEKFMRYQQWHESLPVSPDARFEEFISHSSPLSQKLREKWLYQLAHNKDWANFLKYYQTSPDIGLQCYEKLAWHYQGQRLRAAESSKPLWLQDSSQPKACNDLFTLLLKNKEIDEKLIVERFALALNHRNLSLAIYLLKQLKPSRLKEVETLLAIHQRPLRIQSLNASGLNGAFYLYGLNRLIPLNPNKAIEIWQSPHTRRLLTYAQQQTFLANLAFYKIMKNQPDADAWFAKINPLFYNETLLGAQIRHRLKYKAWHDVIRFISYSKEKDAPCWQYWLARALEATGHIEEAKGYYQTLAHTRNYYGFLASLRLKTKFNFENEHVVNSRATLAPYRPITEQIKALYFSKQRLEASRLLNDFVSELSKNDKSALTYWVDHELQWHGKAVYLSSNGELTNQLSLRFPLAYQDTVVSNSQNYQIPKELIYAIIRQESAFCDNAVSPAGAQGLMQIMPATARVISKHKRIRYVGEHQLLSSQVNINLGVAYLQDLAKRFNKHPILMAAAYNAGPRQVAYWLKTHPANEMDIWIETLPWIETRNYLKNIVAFYAVYQFRMQKTPDLTPFLRNFYQVNPT